MARANSAGVAQAFARRESAKGNNTLCDGHNVWLHGNRIAWYDENGVPHISFCGWATTTTCDRLNAILAALRDKRRVSYKRDGTAFFDGQEVDASTPIPLTGPLGALALAASQQRSE